MNSSSRRFIRPIIIVLVSVAAVCFGLMAGTQDADAEQTSSPSTYAEINGGGGSSDPETR